MYLEVEDIVFTILYTMLYTIISMFMGFRLTEILNGEDGNVEKLTRHFILWPIECLVMLTLGIKMCIEDKYKEKHKK